jgi:hypothetical protein
MVKPTKYLRKQADKAEASARRSSDIEMAENFLAMARAYRSQAKSLKKQKKNRSKRVPA